MQSLNPIKQASFGAVYVVYEDDTWLPFSLQSVYCQCEAIYVLVSDRPWNGPPTSNQAALDCVNSFPDPQKKIRLVHGSWTSETEQRNAGLKILCENGIDYCFIVDADEIYDETELLRMMVFAACLPEVTCWHMQCITYWKSHKYRIEPPEKYYPPVFVRASAASFENGRNVKAEKHATFQPYIGVCHHMSYARTDAQVFRKLETFTHAHEVAPGWFENVWKRWDDDKSLRFLNPAYPAMYDHAVEQPLLALPPVLQRYALRS